MEARRLKKGGRKKKEKFEVYEDNGFVQQPFTPDIKRKKPEVQEVEEIQEVEVISPSEVSELYEEAQYLSQQIQLKSLKINLDALKLLDRSRSPVTKIEGLSRMGLLHHQLFRGTSALLTPIEEEALKAKAKIFALAQHMREGLGSDGESKNENSLVQFYLPDNGRN